MQIEIKGGDTIAASLGKAIGKPGIAQANIAGELIHIAACTKRGTVRLGLESLVSVLLSSGAVQTSALRIMLADAVRHDAGQAVSKDSKASALLAEVKEAIAASVPDIHQPASWRLSNGILVPN